MIEAVGSLLPCVELLPQGVLVGVTVGVFVDVEVMVGVLVGTTVAEPDPGEAGLPLPQAIGSKLASANIPTMANK